MSTTSSKKKTIQAAILECGCQKEKLRSFAEEIVAGLSEIPASENENPLDIFISELVLSAADQRRRAERKQHQLACIAAAKARGVQFGRQPQALPDNFDKFYQAWRSGEMSLRKAAESCGIGKAAFQRAAQRKEQDAGQPVNSTGRPSCCP